MAYKLSQKEVEVLRSALAVFKAMTFDCIEDYEKSGAPGHVNEIAEMKEEVNVVISLETRLYEWTIS